MSQPETYSLADVCQAIYTSRDGGQHAVYAFVRVYLPEIAWGWCEPCEHLSPIDPSDATCLVCGDSNPVPQKETA